ncbi:DEAD/DEAH box helicase [Marinobacterium weihaiense]|uniref:DEAD/DEAH box helicase n=1 Tax=Marinobacterium weihaiense TaxID=2851016 RepID=A0ABS6M724_9GAMM|nr:DEAD/DEAH box helicase [Marinobacterium weihaiense]MBV0932077.1 DEAD/DEAH box helicase [Marinobacterium weihaiense]
MLNFSYNQIQELVDQKTFQRGEAYYLEGRVELLTDNPAADQVQALVDGNRVYTVNLRQAGEELYGRCSCPVGWDCKHVVATALTWLFLYGRNMQGSGRGALPSPLQTWLQQWPGGRPELQADGRVELEPSRQHLLYVLQPRDLGCDIELHKGYLKLNGSWSQVKPFNVELFKLSPYIAPKMLTEMDIAILRQLADGRSGHSSYPLQGRSGGSLLQQMLQTGRLFVYDHYRPLQLSRERELQWQWQSDHDQTRLVPLLTGEPCQVLPLSPLFYLDDLEDVVGPLQTDMAPEQVIHLSRMPPVSSTELPLLSYELGCRLTPEQLALPEQAEKIEHCNQATPVLRLVATEQEAGYWLPGLALAFDYEGCRVPFSDEPEVRFMAEHEGRQLLIETDFATEHQAILRLFDLGLFVQETLDDEPVLRPADVNSLDAFMAAWQHLLDESLPKLQAEGWLVEVDDSYRYDVQTTSFDFNVGDGDNHWFEFGLRLPLGEHQLDVRPVIERWLAEGQPEQLSYMVDESIVQIDTRSLHPLHELILEMFREDRLTGISLPPFKAARLAAEPELELNLRDAPATQQLLEKLQNFSGLQPVAAPQGLQAQLRDYQQQGLSWLDFLQEYEFGGILADDMGLGKTLQTLALIQRMKEHNVLLQPALVLAPTSLMGNWVNEARQFTPDLEVCLIHGPDRAARFAQLETADLVITSYPLILRDAAHYREQGFSLLVLDEAQAIKNPKTKLAKQVRAIQAQRRICLTGTPLENHLGELWALMDFALPGLLGGWQQFNQQFRKPIENDNDADCQQGLARLVAPFMLRRTKQDVVAELPPKSEMVQHVELGGRQRELYEAIRVSMEKRIRDLIASKGMARSHIEFLDALLKLRQACIDPRLVKLDKAANITQSAKLEWLADTLPEMVEEGRRILLFSQFTQALGLIEEVLKQRKIAYSKLTGQTRKRQAAIDRFQSGEVPLFLISLKAGGSGLNLTAADTVIHIDPWWNPAVERQATDRAYRIGQDKPVFVYKLVAMDTVEERIQQMQQQKQALADALFNATGKAALPNDSEALLGLLAG